MGYHKKVDYRCTHCKYGQRCIIEGKEIWYCIAHSRYCPAPLFVQAWGCDEYEDIQLKLFIEERRKKASDNSNNSGTSQGQKDKHN